MSNRVSTDITATHNEDNQSRTTLRIPDGLTPFVRYAETGDNGSPDQFHRLQSLREPVPADTNFVSPVYLLTDEQLAKHDELLSKDELESTAPDVLCAITLSTIPPLLGLLSPGPRTRQSVRLICWCCRQLARQTDRPDGCSVSVTSTRRRELT